MRNGLRLQLFHAELAQSHDEQASAAIEPILPAIRSLLAPPATPDDAQPDNEAPQTDTMPTLDIPYSVDSILNTPASRLSLALALASMHEHTHASAEAITDLQAALELTNAPPQKLTLQSRITTLEDTLNLQRQNNSRLPILQNALTQTNLVRPRLTAAAAQVPK